ncbi:MAG: aromatic ring-hydroxylating dioxygenase subunit alpha [Granulosicoccus sp.]
MLPVDIQSLLGQHQSGYTLPQPFYTDPGIHEHDMQCIFYSQWLFAIPACEIPMRGDFITHTIGRYSLIIVRDAEQQIRAFHNVCRHRGATLCSEPAGQVAKLVCPYHQWTYELDGRLLFAREMGDEFDPADYGLKSIHCRQAGGLVYICLADHAPDFSVYEQRSSEYLAPHILHEGKVAFQSTIVEAGNWKLVFENNRECYHCAGNHPLLCRTFLDDAAAINNSSEDVQHPLFLAHNEKCEAAGAPSRYVAAHDGSWRFVRTPLIGDAESYTADGRVAVRKPLSTLGFTQAGALLLFCYPNTWNHFLSDHSVLFRITPLDATHTQVTTKWIVHKDAVEGQDYSLKTLTEVWEATNSEDRTVVEMCQKGVQSPAYEPGPYSPVHEAGVAQFVDWYATTLANYRHEAVLVKAS